MAEVEEAEPIMILDPEQEELGKLRNISHNRRNDN